MLIYLAVAFCFFLIGSAWGRLSGYRISSTVPFAVIGLLALFNTHIILPSVQGALWKRICVFDGDAQKFFVNGASVSRLFDITRVEVQGKREMRGNYRCRAVVELADRRRIVIAETRRVEPLLHYIKAASASTATGSAALPDYWTRIEQIPSVGDVTCCKELFSIKEAIDGFLMDNSKAKER